MIILGVNPSHHGSICILKEGELELFELEERVIRDKYINYPFAVFVNANKKYEVDYVCTSSPSLTYNACNRHPTSYWLLLSNRLKNKKTETKNYDFTSEHHITHVAHSFYNSGFKKALGIVIDGLGSSYKTNGQETETIYTCEYPHNFKVLYKNIVDHTGKINKVEDVYHISPNLNISRAYEAITEYLGWSREEAGKTMGLAPYGEFDNNLPLFFINKRGNPKVFKPPFDNILKRSVKLKLKSNPKKWHFNPTKITNLEKNIAWKIQNDTQQVVGDYIEKYTKITGLKQVCCSGGYFLNCVTNYYLTKRFPDIEFYFEPLANDAGVAIGAAKLCWYLETKDTTIRPLKSLYLGPKYSKEELLQGIQKYVDN
jgi:carbamoyltransferase